MEQEIREMSEILKTLVEQNKVLQNEVKKLKPANDMLDSQKQNDACTIQFLWIIAFLIAFYLSTLTVIRIFG